MAISGSHEIARVGDVVNGFLDEVESVIADLGRTAQAMQNDASEVRGGVDAIGRDAENQVGRLDDICTRLATLTSVSHETSRQVAAACGNAGEARTKAADGTQTVSDLTGAMGEIRTSSEQIAPVIQVVDEIAFQTNLLALKSGRPGGPRRRGGQGLRQLAEESVHRGEGFKSIAEQAAGRSAAMTERLAGFTLRSAA